MKTVDNPTFLLLVKDLLWINVVGLLAALLSFYADNFVVHEVACIWAA